MSLRSELLGGEVLPFALRNRALILAAALAGAGAGLVAAGLAPETHRGRAIVEAVNVWPEGPIEAIDLAALRLRDSMARDPAGVGLRSAVTVIRKDPPYAAISDLLELSAEGGSPAAIRTLLAHAAEHLAETQDPIYRAKRARIDAQIEFVERSLERLTHVDRTELDLLVELKLMNELTWARRRASEARSFPTRLILAPVVEQVPGSRRAALLIVTGLFAGIGAGLAFALMLAAWAYTHRP